MSAAKKDLLCTFLLLAVCGAVFYQTLFLGKPISNVFCLAHLDILFRESAQGVWSNFDRASFLMKISHYFLAATIWGQGVLPLWNPYGGCGVPLIGEQQAIVMSPWMLFYTLSPSLTTHNLLLVAQEALGTTGMFLAARAIGLSRYAAVFCALAHLLCPHQIWREELQMNHYFYPITMWFFIRLAQSPGLGWAFLAGAGCAATILSGDVQVSILSILVVSSMFLCYHLFERAGQENWFARLREGFLWLTLAGLNAFCLSAPMFVPFLEYFLNCDVPKKHAYYAIGNEAPWQSLTYAFFHPVFGGASLFAGILAVPLVLLSLFALKPKRKWYAAVLISTVIAFMSASRTGPFPLIDQLTGLMGLSRFEGMEALLVQVCLLMAFGLEELVERTTICARARYAVFSLSLVAAAIVPWLLNAGGFDITRHLFDSHLDQIGFNSKLWVQDVVILSVVLAVVSLRSRLPSRIPVLVAVTVIAVNSLSEGASARRAEPVRPLFSYGAVDPLPFLAAKNERVVPIGHHLLLPNTNFIYLIPTVTFHGPTAPARYRNFVNAAGGQCDGFNGLFPSAVISPMLDIASARYFLTLTPLFDGGAEAKEEKIELKEAVSFEDTDKIKLLSASLRYSPDNSEVKGHLDWHVKEGFGEKYGYTVVVYDDNGNAVWTGGPYYVRERAWRNDDRRPDEYSRVELGAVVPLGVAAGTPLTVGIFVSDIMRGKPLTPSVTHTGKDKNILALRRFKTVRQATGSMSERFRLIKESGPHRIRVYENKKAVPACYLVHKTRAVDSQGAALKEISHPDFDPRHEAIVESKVEMPEAASHLEDQLRQVAAQLVEKVEYKRPDVNNLEVKVNSPAGGFLVVTDTFYPGWQAFVDGKETRIERANYLFKGLVVPPGNHQILLTYRPMSFVLGMLLFIAALAVNASAIIFLATRTKASPRAPDCVESEKKTVVIG